MTRPKKVKVINLLTGEEYIYNSPLEAATDLESTYTTVMSWVHGRTKSNKYKAFYV